LSDESAASPSVRGGAISGIITLSIFESKKSDFGLDGIFPERIVCYGLPSMESCYCWVGEFHFRRLLKSDLLDESVGEDSYGVAAGIADEIQGIDISAELVQPVSRGNLAVAICGGSV
jgi:hypothetical protein